MTFVVIEIRKQIRLLLHENKTISCYLIFKILILLIQHDIIIFLFFAVY